ncbi:MAG: sigma-70 family RNA polymerase sigma factor [Clostridia bacterium]|nr:sigma-70 family RNA polymerase sigma factor [Clostridia bacterium]
MYEIDEICKKYYSTVFKYLMSLTSDTDISEELTQETFCIAIKEISKFKGKCALSTWLCVIAKHLYYNEIKKKTKFKVSEFNENDIQEISFEEKIILDEERIEVYKKLQDLDETTKNLIYLRLLGFSFKEISKILEKSESWCKVVYHRGKKKLEKILKGGITNEHK